VGGGVVKIEFCSFPILIIRTLAAKVSASQMPNASRGIEALLALFFHHARAIFANKL
jgi:hypothetical protein